MKLAVNLALSFGMLGLCLWLVWPDLETRAQLGHVIDSMRWHDFAPWLAAYFGLLVVTHLCRALRWNNLLAPLGVKIPAGPLLAISSVGFMAILALPARLGEFVRPGLLRKRGISATAALGTVAVERIVDGLLVSIFVFGAFFALRGPSSPGWMMPTAYAALGVFSIALFCLVFAMRRPALFVKITRTCFLAVRTPARFVDKIEAMVIKMIRGFDVLKDINNLGAFVAWSAVYWTTNGLGVWVLAHAFHLDLSLVGAFATMGLVAVGITLPNSPGLVGQFQWFTLLGVSLYITDAATKGSEHYAIAFAFANTHYILQVAWYVLMGALGLLTPWVSLHDMWDARKTGPDDK